MSGTIKPEAKAVRQIRDAFASLLDGIDVLEANELDPVGTITMRIKALESKRELFIMLGPEREHWMR